MRHFLLVLLALAAAASCSAPRPTTAGSSAPASTLPIDSAVVRGTLPNGMTYYVRRNARPEERAELRLAVRAGSILEDEDQRGLAHFVEHMAFNGTRRFQKQELVDYLESIGIRFGPDLNAYTSSDETVYMLQVPTDSVALLARGLDVLEDWAHGIMFDSVEIDNERGVVIEEWRSRRGAESRMRELHMPVILNDSRYADRSPIGLKEVLDTFHHERLRAFYRDWYRPELMAVIAVGDFDADAVVEMIKERFGRIPASRTATQLPEYPVPDHPGTLTSIATDPEATRAAVNVYWRHPATDVQTETDYRRALVESSFHSILGQRFYEASRVADPPFQYASTGSAGFTPTKDFTTLQIGVDETKILRGLEAAMIEIERVRRHGFLQSELDRQITELLRGYRKAFAERSKTESGAFASEYASNFLRESPALGIERELQLAERMIPTITLAELNALADQLMPPDNRAVTVSAPRREGLTVPSGADLLATIDRVSRSPVEPYTEALADRPLVDSLPVAGRVIAERRIDSIDVVEWRLSNGIRMLLKPTDFKDDEVLLTAFGRGGSSLAADSDFIHAASAVAAATEGGLGAFGRVELEKALTGRIAGVTPYIAELSEGFSGYASTDDLETLFQLVYLTVTQPRFDSAAFESDRSKSRTSVRNRRARPESARSDTLQAILSGYHPRRQAWTEATYDAVDPARALAFYRDRFDDVGDFTFVLVGSFDPAAIRPLVEQYVATLPASGTVESWKDIGAVPPDTKVERTIRRGTEPKASVDLVFTGTFEWSSENRSEMFAMASVLEIMLREAIREDKGGSYFVNVYASPSHLPRDRYSMTISFGCAPDRVAELTAVTYAVIDSLKKFGPSAANLTKIREAARREHETNLRENRYWLGQLQAALTLGDPITRLLVATQEYERVSAERIRAAANRYLDPARLVKVVLLPEQVK